MASRIESKKQSFKIIPTSISIYKKQPEFIFGAAIAAAFFLLLAPPNAALACAGTGMIQAKQTSFKLDDKLPEFTVFWNSDGTCASNKVQITARYSVSGQTFDVAALDCPSPNVNGNYCVVSGNVYQMVVANSGFTFNVGGKGNVEAWVSVDGAFVHKTPPLEFTISGGAGDMPVAKIEKAAGPVEARLSVAIGGLTQTSNIAVYLGTIYNWGLTVVTILAVTMLVWGGVKYLTAGGDMSRTGSAKTTISNAVIGLILAFATYLILNTINPALLNFKSIEPAPITRAIATNETSCEAILSKFAHLQTVPPTGACGDKGTVSLKPGQSGTVATDSCTFSTCPAGLGCGTVDGKPKCVRCQDYTDAKLKTMGILNATDQTCANFGPKVYGRIFAACVYTNDTGLGERGCARLDLGCANVKTCQDYQKFLTINSSGEFRGAQYERRCLMDVSKGPFCVYQGPGGHLSYVCNINDPCGVPGGCKVADNPSLGDITKYSGESAFLTVPFQLCVPTDWGS